jgi:hypothetical protein|tara:strand:+ start:250 stop:426 length:177 start_codon:yes stop_codon:yes gene_type:complete
LIAKDKKTKNKNRQVGNRFELKHVESWLKERRGLDSIEPQYIGDRDGNFHDFLSIFFD